jgi:hypothetical protein
LQDLVSRLANRIQLTTDGLRLSVTAVETGSPGTSITRRCTSFSTAPAALRTNADTTLPSAPRFMSRAPIACRIERIAELASRGLVSDLWSWDLSAAGDFCPTRMRPIPSRPAPDRYAVSAAGVTSRSLFLQRPIDRVKLRTSLGGKTNRATQTP